MRRNGNMFKNKFNLINYAKAYFILLFILVLINSSSDEIKNVLFIYKSYIKLISFLFFNLFLFELYL